jgi:histidinol dehydrogenase
MLGIPARLAGCTEIVVCTPPLPDGSVHPAILFCASELGISRVFRIGGAQAIAAMAYGTETVPRVNKIFGPGNQFVTEAKKIVQQEGTAIDMPAGPSELAIFADDTADPACIAADLLSQCEHGSDSQVILVTESCTLADKVREALQIQWQTLPRKEVAGKSLANSRIFLVQGISIAMDLLNAYAPEHLILNCAEADHLTGLVKNAGSVFLGNFSPESAGDYASGTNHTLPTNGFARSYSGVSVDSFVKKISFQELTPNGLRLIQETIVNMARAEGLEAHARAVDIRFKKS